VKLISANVRIAKKNHQSPFYIFEDMVQSSPGHVSIWSRQGEYTRCEVGVRANQYATYFLQLGVVPGELVAFYLQNSPEFFFAWLGLLTIDGKPLR
jgi:acyl-CoA synthetase (AMP-forming)/AMP-acid ligase II